MKVALLHVMGSQPAKRLSVSEILRASYRKFTRDKFTRKALGLLMRKAKSQ